LNCRLFFTTGSNEWNRSSAIIEITITSQQHILNSLGKIVSGGLWPPLMSNSVSWSNWFYMQCTKCIFRRSVFHVAWIYETFWFMKEADTCNWRCLNRPSSSLAIILHVVCRSTVLSVYRLVWESLNILLSMAIKLHERAFRFQ
jgi:hypothetical protein